MSIKNWKKQLHAFLSLILVLSLFVPTVGSTVSAETVATDLIISEYIEGSSFNKAIELYNGTGATIDLNEYSLELHTNGAATAANKVTLSGSLASGETYVLYNTQANADIQSKGNYPSNAVINFNGNDPVVLRKSGNVIDSIGQVGSAANFAVDVTLVRKSTVTSGDTVIDDPFDFTGEWIQYAKDDTSNLGLHEMGGTPVDPVDPEPTNPDVISIAEARNTAIGEIVTIKGIVAANLKNTISVQDATGGIAVRPTSLPITVGDEVTLTGKLADYRGLLQLDASTVVEKGENVGAPSTKIVTGAEVNESHESQIITVNNVSLTAIQQGSGWANFTAHDGTDFIVRDEGNSLGLALNTNYESITGIVQQFDNDYQLIPRSTQDIIMDSKTITPAVASPSSGTFVGGTNVTLSTTTANAEIFYTVDGTDPTDSSIKYESPIAITENTVLKTIVKTQDGSLSDISTFTYTITDALQIHDLQGEGHRSPFDGTVVEGIQGVVTYAFTLNGSYYYTIQTPDTLADQNPNTSEAILLYSGRNAWSIEVGDLVSVSGKVSEYAYDGYSDANQTDLKTTQINVRNDQGGNVVVKQRGVALPTPVIIDESNMDFKQIDSDSFNVFNPTIDAIDFWESIEGMRVQVGNVKAVAPQEHGDLITVLESTPTNSIHGGVLFEEGNTNPNRIQFRLEPNGAARNLEVATGDKFTGPITGIVGYSYQNYKIYVSLDEMTAKYRQGTTTPETTKIVKAEDKLTIASYNLENFSNNKTETTNDKARKLARAIAVDMQSPDIVGVTEVQDNNGQTAGNSAANESYERLIQAIVDAGGPRYSYLNIDPINNADGGAPNANIRVGFLYNPQRVSLPDGIQPGDATTAVGYENGKLTLNPGRIDPTNAAFNSSRKPLAAQFVFQGEELIVIANHWNSKSGDTPLFGATQPPVNNSEIQRKNIAQIVYNFVSDIKSQNPEANIVSLGDFNDYQFAQALKIHEGEWMSNMINKVEESDRYTYLYQGNSQVLDHILVSNNLVNKTVVDILHINADFTDMAGRASDHDPVLVQIDLAGGEIIEPIIAEKIINLINFQTKQFTINKRSVSVTMDAQSVITEGILFTGDYAEFLGEGYATHEVTIKPENAGAIIDFKGTVVQKVIIDGTNVKEVRGGENIQELVFINGALKEKIKFE
ncbi:chitobiase/beta-hexosaminidase C-terminal domain-containing protein [Solibacillus sp. FSL R7-0682]|uniref:chitobiase/beta-hexosaminidase C-terminal domain-containing protein n=1 Tax=Solibacillus sp. FSL R7-0682 TaxID=2921690 RepID=UPI0030F9E6C8